MMARRAEVLSAAYERHQGYAVRMVRSWLGRRSRDAEDVVQDAFENLARADVLPAEDERGQAALVLRALRWAYASYWRAQGAEMRDARRSVSLEQLTRSGSSWEPAAPVALERLVELREEVARVGRAVGRLTPGQRAALARSLEGQHASPDRRSVALAWKARASLRGQFEESVA